MMNEKELLKEIYDYVINNNFYINHNGFRSIEDTLREQFHRGIAMSNQKVLEIFEKHNYKPEETNEK
jgi:hypothetical protein